MRNYKKADGLPPIGAAGAAVTFETECLAPTFEGPARCWPFGFEKMKQDYLTNIKACNEIILDISAQMNGKALDHFVDGGYVRLLRTAAVITNQRK